MDQNTKAQAFMNEHQLKQCFECDGIFFKHEENAAARSQDTGKEMIIHEANAGAREEN